MKNPTPKISDADLLSYTEAIFDFPPQYNCSTTEQDYEYGFDYNSDDCTSYTKGYRVRRVKDLLRSERPFWATC